MKRLEDNYTLVTEVFLSAFKSSFERVVGSRAVVFYTSFILLDVYSELHRFSLLCLSTDLRGILDATAKSIHQDHGSTNQN